MGARSLSPLAIHDHGENVQPNANEKLKRTIKPNVRYADYELSTIVMAVIETMKKLL